MRPRRADVDSSPLLCALVIAALVAACSRGILDAASPYPQVELTIRDATIVADLTDTTERKRRGLSKRPSLGQDRGMLFPYDPPDTPRFWMKDMQFDIDIVWIREGRIVDLTHRARHDISAPVPRYGPREPVDHVLEVEAGTAQRHGWRIGDRVRMERTLEPRAP